ncbi:uncharacterized protein Triagg1_4319 [Trichoderma aggressivum f. europaeum]|uniref:Uncharacterized protein n=1 Tax=Trichoderma aggressivum f. europaeum TaxID=173218 RepID=A0AAE1IEB6_9HYPO|nr:hypothetical protein Triagg1_4319 [Trichoderma aggressivum f. europaeum]
MVQRTFTIVPPAGPAERTPVDSRPMTSKQVRKAYKEANRIPRVSRAEQLRQERAEQERIRKEFEKEKAALKAKTLREKKRAREQAEREEKKKKGLPLVNVRPSQDTIAWFVRGKGAGTKRDCRGQNAATTPVLPIVEEPEEDEDDFPSPKRLCNQEQQKEAGCEKEDYLEEEFEGGEFEEEDFEEPVEKSEEVLPALEEPATKIDTTPEKNQRTAEEDFLGGFEIMSDDEMSRLSFNQVTTKPSVISTEDRLPTCPEATPAKQEKGHSHHEITLHKPESPITIKNPKPLALPEFDLISDDEDDLEQEMLALDVALISQKQLSKQPVLVLVSQGSQKPARSATGYEMDLGLATNLLNHTSQEKRSKRDEQASLMPPPPIPAAPQRSRSPISPVAMKPQAPPLSTQQILFNMDDFFPTSSQQAAELEEEETTFISQPSKSCSMPRPQVPSPIPEKIQTPHTASSSPEPPKPFFTSSGSNERLAVALLRSRRTAEQEEEQRRRALQLEALELEEAKKRDSERRAREKRLADSKPKTNVANYTPTRTEPREKGQAPRQTRPAAATTPQFSMRKGFTTNPNRTPANTSVQRTPLVASRANAALPTTGSRPTAEMKRPLPLGNTPRKQSTTTTVKGASKPLPLKVQITRLETPKKVSKEKTTSPGISEAKHLFASQESEFGGSWMDELATEIAL